MNNVAQCEFKTVLEWANAAFALLCCLVATYHDSRFGVGGPINFASKNLVHFRIRLPAPPKFAWEATLASMAHARPHPPASAGFVCKVYV
jgi:hypothetical protein